jgi:hypothetical protein
MAALSDRLSRVEAPCLDRAAIQCKPIQVSDIEADPDYNLEKVRGLAYVLGRLAQQC